MNKFLLAFFIVALLLSVNSVAAQSDIQVVLKSQNLGLDKNYGVYRANITITMNKIGNVTYREAYYMTDFSSGSAGAQTLFRTSSYNPVMKDYTVSFPVTRPGLKSERNSWNSIKATILLDKEVVYEVLMPTQSGTYRSSTSGNTAWTNDSTIKIGKTRPVIEKKPSSPFTPVTTNDVTDDVTTDVKNDTDNRDTEKKSPTIGTFIIVVTMFSVYMLLRGKGNNNR